MAYSLLRSRDSVRLCGRSCPTHCDNNTLSWEIFNCIWTLTSESWWAPISVGPYFWGEWLGPSFWHGIPDALLQEGCDGTRVRSKSLEAW